MYYIVNKENDDSFDLKYVLSLLNSKLYYLWLYYRGKRKGENLELYQKPLSEIPIKKISKIDQKPFVLMSEKILNITKDGAYLSDVTKRTKVLELERQIDQMVYELYKLTARDIAFIEESIDKSNF